VSATGQIVFPLWKYLLYCIRISSLFNIFVDTVCFLYFARLFYIYCSFRKLIVLTLLHNMQFVKINKKFKYFVNRKLFRDLNLLF